MSDSFGSASRRTPYAASAFASPITGDATAGSAIRLLPVEACQLGEARLVIGAEAIGRHRISRTGSMRLGPIQQVDQIVLFRCWCRRFGVARWDSFCDPCLQSHTDQQSALGVSICKSKAPCRSKSRSVVPGLDAVLQPCAR